MIVVADNMHSNNYVMRTALEAHDFNCFAAYSWSDLRKCMKARGAKLSCIVVDCDLPGGNLLCEIEKIISDNPSVNIILTGCYPGCHEALRVQEKQQVHAYMVKPFSIWTLVSTVKMISGK